LIAAITTGTERVPWGIGRGPGIARTRIEKWGSFTNFSGKKRRGDRTAWNTRGRGGCDQLKKTRKKKAGKNSSLNFWGKKIMRPSVGPRREPLRIRGKNFTKPVKGRQEYPKMTVFSRKKTGGKYPREATNWHSIPGGGEGKRRLTVEQVGKKRPTEPSEYEGGRKG